MTRMIRSSVLLAACVTLWSCTNDPTADEAGKPYQIVAVPGVVFVQQDADELVGFQLQDELGGSIPEAWTIDASSPYFGVAFDSTYRPVYNPDGTLTLPEAQTEVRATISGLALGIDSFTVSAGGKTLTIRVNVVPGRLYATFSPSNPAPGEAVTMTMPPTLRLTPASTVTFPGNLTPVSLVIAPDSMSATFIPAPTTDTTATVSGVFNTEFPTVAVASYNTVDKVTGTKSNQWDGTLQVVFSDPTPTTLPITATLDPDFAFKITAPLTVLDFPGQVNPQNVTFSADSSTATLLVGPNVGSPLRATRITFRGAPQFEYSLVSSDSVVSPVIPDLPVVMSTIAPLVGDTVTITAAPGFTFSLTSTVTWPLGATALVANSANGSSTITVLPMPGSSGLPTFTGVINASYPTFPLTLKASGTPNLVVQNASIYGGRDNPGTATALTIPPVLTDTLEFYDLFSSPTVDQFYRLSFAANATLALRMSWGNTADVDMLVCTSDSDPGTPGVQPGGPGCNSFFGGFGGATGANPENMPAVAFVTGQFFLWSNLYAGSNPPWLRIRIIRTS